MIKSGKGDKSMKKRYLYISLLAIVLIIAGVFLMFNLEKFSMKRDLKARNMIVIWDERELKGEAVNNISRLYQYNFGGQEIILEDKYKFFDFTFSDDKQRLLSFVGNRGKFDIVEYDMEKRQLKPILSSQEVEEYLEESVDVKGKQSKEGSCVRYYDHENKISFRYGSYIMSFSETEGFEILYSSGSLGRTYDWIENDSALLIIDGTDLIKYSIKTKEKTTLIEQSASFSFAVSSDDKFLVYEDRGDGYLYLCNLEDGEKRRLCRRYHPFPDLQISEDNKYLLCSDAVEIFPSTMKYWLYIVNLENGRRLKIKDWGLDAEVWGATWNQ